MLTSRVSTRGDTAGMSSSARFGRNASLAALVTSIGYAVPQILQVLGVLRDPWDRILIFAPSLLLAPSFVCAMSAALDLADQERRAAAHAAFGLSIMYGTLVGAVYVIQLGVVIPHDLRGQAVDVASFACCTPGMPLTAVDLLGYSLMSVATWLLAGSLAPTPRHRWLRRALLANGWLVFALVGQLVAPALIHVGALWLVTFPAAMFLLWREFRPAR